ncbi:MAG: cytochrome c oxidase subunit II [Gemmatimonadales bacterium]|nr:MAG: cytochrome c oxidase subunit II [Gemmatimonadales bacterium]
MRATLLRYSPGLLLLTLVLSGCGVEYPQSSISPHSDFAHIIHGLYTTIFWWTMLILAVVWVLLTWVIIKYRAKPDDPKPKQIRGHLGLEIGWTVGPAIIVVLIAIPTIQAVFATQQPVSEDAMLVEVTGERFWWEFHYPEYGITTANELWLEKDRPVNLRLASSDVIHSFWVPKLGGKRDLNPTVAVREGEEPSYNWLFFTPEVAGHFYGQCAEFCGESHAFMLMRVNVAEPDDFAAWTESWQASPGALAEVQDPDEEGRDAGLAIQAAQDGEIDETPLVAEGREAFLNQATCGACHAIEGTHAQGDRGPNLTLFGTRRTLAAGIMENNQENLVEWIRDPWRFKPAAAMPGTDYDMEGTAGFWPATALSDEQLEAVAAYLLSLK